jgi:hypothetical protein
MEENVSGQYQRCPYCAEEIPADAGHCPRCNSLLGSPEQHAEQREYQAVYTTSNGTSGKGFAITSFVLGILGVLPCCCCVGTMGSVLAIVFGFLARSQMKASGDDQMSWMSTTGIVLGIVGVVFGILGTLIWVVLTVLSPHNGPWNFQMPH